ncbi:MAG: ndvB, partial [Alphaproteobacteria bacterium]|nr:ndvB [Alphaproteobacteria bacterium]
MTSFLRHLHDRFTGPSPFDGKNNDVLKSELLSAEQMGQYGRVLAARHKLSNVQGRDSLLARLADNEQVIIDAYQVLVDAVAAKQQVTPAGEWMLDNFYLIEEQVEIAKRHLPRGYSRGLPRLAKGPSDSLPRVYDIAL